MVVDIPPIIVAMPKGIRVPETWVLVLRPTLTSTGNINTTGKATLFLMDYPSQSRLKVWAHAEVVGTEQDSKLSAALETPGYDATVERLIVFRIQAFDWNCPQHITPRYTADEISEEVMKRNPNIVKPCCPDEE